MECQTQLLPSAICAAIPNLILTINGYMLNQVESFRKSMGKQMAIFALISSSTAHWLKCLRQRPQFPKQACSGNICPLNLSAKGDEIVSRCTSQHGIAVKQTLGRHEKRQNKHATMEQTLIEYIRGFGNGKLLRLFPRPPACALS
jgi:hypothetical protein